MFKNMFYEYRVVVSAESITCPHLILIAGRSVHHVLVEPISYSSRISVRMEQNSDTVRIVL